MVCIMIRYIKHNLAIKLDSVGFIASTLCAIHCAAMPFIFLFLTLYGLQFIANPVIEFIFISTSVLIGIFTFRHGFFNHHRKLYPFLIFLSGLTIIFIGHFYFHDHKHDLSGTNSELIFLLISPVGALLIGIGHYLNRKLSKKKINKTCNC